MSIFGSLFAHAPFVFSYILVENLFVLLAKLPSFATKCARTRLPIGCDGVGQTLVGV